MSFLFVSRSFSSFLRTRNPKFSLTTLASTTPADKYWIHLQNNDTNIEKTLNTVRAKLDSSCIKEVLKRCSTLNQRQLLGIRFFIWAGLQPDYRHSLYMYGNACKLFRIKQNPSVIRDVIEAYAVEKCVVSVKTFKVILSLCKQAKLANEGLWVLKKMKDFNCRPDTEAYNIVITLFCEKGDMDEALRLMGEMESMDLYPDMVTFVALVKKFCDLARIEDACRLFKVLKRQGCSPNVVLYTALLDGVCKFGSLERGLELLEEMEKEGRNCVPTVVTYTSVIQNFCEKGRSMEALTILDRMEACGCVPSKVTVNVFINGFCLEDRVEEAYKLIDRVVANRSIPKSDCYSSLVATLFKLGKFAEAEELFRRMLTRDLRPDGFATSILLRRLCLQEQRYLDAFVLYDEIERPRFISSIDSDIYSIMLDGLCSRSYLLEAVKLAKFMVQKGVQLKAPYIDNIVEHLKNSGEPELVSRISKVSVGGGSVE